MNISKLVTLTLGVAKTLNGLDIGITLTMTLVTIAYTDSYMFVRSSY